MTPPYVLVSGDIRAESRQTSVSRATSDTVRVTLGRRLKSFLTEIKCGYPPVCGDVITLTKKNKLNEVEENLGTRFLHEVNQQTSDPIGTYAIELEPPCGESDSEAEAFVCDS